MSNFRSVIATVHCLKLAIFYYDVLSEWHLWSVVKYILVTRPQLIKPTTYYELLLILFLCMVIFLFKQINIFSM
jgi:hypothetical protein